MGTTSGPVGPGAGIGPYRVLRTLGRGGMGVVLEAADDALGRTVALKLIAPHLAADPDFRARFTREAQVLAALASPHTVTVHAHGETEGRLWLATELLPDGDLGALLREHGPLPPRAALDLVAQVAAGLADAHAAGVVHRDLKPANVLLRRRDDGLTARLGDFGLARSPDRAGEPSLTGTVGTPAYLAPELHTGARAGVATDVYALGCLLWATLTGGPPYRGETDYQLARAHLEHPVPQLPGRSSLVRHANRVLRATLAKDPVQRPGAAQVRDELARASRAPDHRSRPPGVVTATALAVLLAGGAGWAWVERDGPTPVAPATARERAVASLAADLVDRGELGAAEARCTAGEWVERSGLERMRAERLFDTAWEFRDVPVTELSRRTASDAAAATVACLSGPRGSAP